jgi:hypothetical protein
MDVEQMDIMEFLDDVKLKVLDMMKIKELNNIKKRIYIDMDVLLHGTLKKKV